MMVFFAILAVFLMFGMIGDKLQDNRNNYTKAFITTVAAIVVLYVFR